MSGVKQTKSVLNDSTVGIYAYEMTKKKKTGMIWTMQVIYESYKQQQKNHVRK